MNADLDVLKDEFEAEEGSFLIQIRCELIWDKAAFTRLTSAMRTCCEQSCQSEKLDRWVAEGFWYLSHFVRDWTTHAGFPRPHSLEYYEKAYERLDDLAYSYFRGESPYEKGAGFEPM